MKLRLMICAAAASTALFATEDANSATYAVMNVTNAYTDTIVAVPWVGLDGTAITISNLVNTTTLTAGDKLYMYDNDNGTWYECTKNADGQWEGSTTVSGASSLSATSQTVGRGTGLILQRAASGAGGTVLLAGRVGTNSVSTTIAGATTVGEETVKGKTLFANPTTAAVDINTKFKSATNGDTISIPQNNGGTEVYTFNGTTWGTNTWTETTFNGRKRKTKGWSACGSIPAGTGAWYEAAGAGYIVTW